MNQEKLYHYLGHLVWSIRRNMTMGEYAAASQDLWKISPSAYDRHRHELNTIRDRLKPNTQGIAGDWLHGRIKLAHPTFRRNMRDYKELYQQNFPAALVVAEAIAEARYLDAVEELKQFIAAVESNADAALGWSEEIETLVAQYEKTEPLANAASYRETAKQIRANIDRYRQTFLTPAKEMLHRAKDSSPTNSTRTLVELTETLQGMTASQTPDSPDSEAPSPAIKRAWCAVMARRLEQEGINTSQIVPINELHELLGCPEVIFLKLLALSEREPGIIFDCYKGKSKKIRARLPQDSQGRWIQGVSFTQSAIDTPEVKELRDAAA